MNPDGQVLGRFGKSASILVVMTGMFVAPVTGQDRVDPVKWSELAGTVGNRDVSLTMPDGAIVEGTVVEVRDDALNFRIKKSSDSRYRRSATVAIPRASVRVLQTRELSGSWRAIAAAIGAGGGIVAGWAIAEGVFHTSGEGQGIWREPEGPVLILGIGAGGGLAGYLAGRKADRRVTYLKIVP